MRLFIPIILLGFLIAEIFLLITLGQRYGIWLLIYLVLIGYLGLQLIRGEKQMMSAKMMQSLKAGGNPMKSMMGSARNMIAGIFLMIPGVITDVIAAILLLIPIQQPKVNPNAGSYHTDDSSYEANFEEANQQPANDDIIEGEYTEIKEPIDDDISAKDKDTGKE
ncbi:MAG: FxsA family protein [Methylophilaceae bacterium]